MGLKDLFGKATSGAIDDAIEKAGDAIDQATGNKFKDQVDSVQAKAKEALGDKGQAPAQPAPETPPAQ